MAVRFDGSSNQYTDALLNFLSQNQQSQQAQQQKMQLLQYKQQQEQKNSLTQLKWMKDMGLIGGMDDTQAPSGPSSVPSKTTTGSLAMPANAAMSLIGGGMGDSSGKPIDVAPSSSSSSPENVSHGTKKMFPFLAMPKSGGGFSFIKNPDYTPASKKSQQSSISDLDISGIKTPKTQEERQVILDSLPPDVATNVQSAGSYKIDANTLYGLRNNSGDRAKFDALTGKIYPNWTSQGYDAKKKYMDNLSSGQLSQNVTSLNTLAHHLGTFQDTMKDMQSKGMPAQNAFINAVKSISGDPTITDFDTAKEVVDNEVQRALTGVGVTQAGVDRAGKTINKNSSYSQMGSYVNLMKGIVKGRIDPLREQYKNNMGEDENGQIVYPETKKYFDSTDETPADDTQNNQDYSSLWK